MKAKLRLSPPKVSSRSDSIKLPTPAQVQAARLVVQANRKLGKVTPEKLMRISRGQAAIRKPKRVTAFNFSVGDVSDVWVGDDSADQEVEAQPVTDLVYKDKAGLFHVIEIKSGIRGLRVASPDEFSAGDPSTVVTELAINRDED